MSVPGLGRLHLFRSLEGGIAPVGLVCFTGIGNCDDQLLSVRKLDNQTGDAACRWTAWVVLEKPWLLWGIVLYYSLNGGFCANDAARKGQSQDNNQQSLHLDKVPPSRRALHPIVTSASGFP